MSSKKENNQDKDIEVMDETVEETADNCQEQADENAVDNNDSETNASDDNSESEDTSKKKDPKDAVIEELQDRVKRQMAEFDNFRKRTEKEKSMMFEMGAADILKKLLPIVDNFERGFKAVTDEELEAPFTKGMDMVYKQILKMFEDLQVKPIEAINNEFNPELHNAVMHVDDDSVGENIVVEEFEKGYTYRDSVIRHSMVKVAN